MTRICWCIIVSHSYYLDFRRMKHVFWNGIKLSLTGSIFFHFSGRAINGGLLMQRYFHLEGYVSSTLHYHWHEMASTSCKMGLNQIDHIPSMKLIHSYLLASISAHYHQLKGWLGRSRWSNYSLASPRHCPPYSRHYVPARAFSKDTHWRQAEIENSMWIKKVLSCRSVN